MNNRVFGVSDAGQAYLKVSGAAHNSGFIKLATHHSEQMNTV